MVKMFQIVSTKTKSQLKNLFKLVLASLLFLAAVLVFLFFFWQAELQIEVKSNTFGNTQFFYPSDKQILSEDNSYITNLSTGWNRIVVPIPLMTKWIRWDPVNGHGGNFLINSIYIKLPFIEIPVRSEYVHANMQINELAIHADGISLVTMEKADDPSVKIQLPWGCILIAQLAIKIILTSLIFLVCIFHKRVEHFYLQFCSLIQTKFQRDIFNKIGILVLIACLFWFGSLGFYAISIDDEYAIFRDNQDVWVGQGRWTVYLLTKFLLPQPVIPFLPNLIFCISTAISYLIIIRINNIKFDWKSTLLFPIFMAFPVWYFISEFYANLLATSVGLIIVSITLLIFNWAILKINNPISRRASILLFVLQGVLLCTAIGAYQSYFFAFISMGLSLIVFNIISTDSSTSIHHIAKQVTYLFFLAITSFILYQLISSSFQFVLRVPPAYIDGFIQPHNILSKPWKVIFSTFFEAIKIYMGDAAIFGVTLGATGILMGLGMIALYNLSCDWKTRFVVFSLSFCCLFIPFLINLLAGGATLVPYRSMVAVPYVIWFFAFLALYKGITLLKPIAVIAIASLLFQLINAHSTYNASTQLALEHDKIFAAAIYNRIVEKLAPNESLANYKVDFYGAPVFSMPFSKIPTSTIGHSFFDWDGGNPNRILSFMRVIGYGSIDIISNCLERKELIKYYDDMPIWPSTKSVKLMGNVFLVKLGNDPDLTNLNSTIECLN